MVHTVCDLKNQQKDRERRTVAKPETERGREQRFDKEKERRNEMKMDRRKRRRRRSLLWLRTRWWSRNRENPGSYYAQQHSLIWCLVLLLTLHSWRPAVALTSISCIGNTHTHTRTQAHVLNGGDCWLVSEDKEAGGIMFLRRAHLVPPGYQLRSS